MEIILGPYNSPIKTNPHTLYNMNMMNNKEHFTSTTSSNTNDSNNNDNNNNNNDVNDGYIVISPYLDKYVKLWIWDWDDTLIDLDAYNRHYMDKNTISNLTDAELENDVPNYKYFRYLIEYLLKNGRRVGIASFGTYSIIRAYMDRIFGFGQRYFNEINIHAVCKDIGSCEIRNNPINKNSYIQRLMRFYKIDNVKEVVFFDDMPSNIADASRLGVIPIQIESLNIPKNYNLRNNLEAKRNILFGPHVMINLESKIRNMCHNNPLEYDKSFGQLGDFKVMKINERLEGDIINKELIPNFNVEHFKKINSYNNKKKKKMEQKSHNNKFDDILEGFNVDNNPPFYNNTYSTYFNNMDTYLTGLFKDNNHTYINDKTHDLDLNTSLKKIDGFMGCMSCQNQGSTWIAGILFIILILLIVGMFYLG
jgi:hypothetical protein